MISRRRILVVGNYPADRLQSMDRYSELLVRLYRPYAQVSLIRPRQIVTRIPGLPGLVRKYLAYIDKLLLFPLWLAIRARAFDLVHIADHSNGFYAFCCPRPRSLVTCHDLLAVRGAMGDRDSACTASPLGPLLQRLIITGLRHSGRLLFVSQATLDDYQRLGGGPSAQSLAVIPNPLNAAFTSEVSDLSIPPAVLHQLPDAPFLLMVGSALPRKNRGMALRLLEKLGDSSPYYLVFAGAPLGSGEALFQRSHPLGNRLVSIVRPSHELLNYLYCRAHALLFPSFSEGFGWPLIEAQACNCPVIASTTTSIPEVGGSGALYASPNDTDGFFNHVIALENNGLRAELIQRGRSNLQRFSTDQVTTSYLQFAFPS